MKYKLYEEVCFIYNKKTLYGQIINAENNRHGDTYKIICHVDESFYPIWVLEKDIIPDRRTLKKRRKKERRQKPLDK